MVEAIYCGVYPLLPMRLSYPEHIPSTEWGEYYYETDLQFEQRLFEILKSKAYLQSNQRLQSFVDHYDWRRLVALYDEQFNQLSNG